MIDLLLQFFAIVVLLAGLYLMGNQKRLGPLLAAVAEVLWVVVGVTNQVWGLVLLSIILGILQGRAFVKWANEPWV